MEIADGKLDYAPHYLEAQAKLKEAHELLKYKLPVEAATRIDQAIVALRLMRATVRSHIE